jgi:hypothetical protein
MGKIECVSRKAQIKGAAMLMYNRNLIFRATTGRIAYLVEFPNSNDIRI